MKKKFLGLFKKAKKKGYRVFIPYIYLVLLVFSFLVSVFGTYIPALSICPAMFGTEICAPIGVYFGLIASLPGYFLVSQLMPKSDFLSWYVTLILVFTVSGFIYFLLGLFIDKYKSYKSPSKKLSLTIFSVFIVLLVALLVILAN